MIRNVFEKYHLGCRVENAVEGKKPGRLHESLQNNMKASDKLVATETEINGQNWDRRDNLNKAYDRLNFEDEAETKSRYLILEVQYTDQQHLHHLGGLLKMQNLRLHLGLTDSESAFLTRSQLIHVHRIKLGSAV